MIIDTVIWDDDNGMEAALVTRLPLDFTAPGHHETRYPEESLDGSVVEVVRTNIVQDEFTFTVHHEPASTMLEELRRAALNGRSLRLANATDPGMEIAVTAVPGIVGTVQRSPNAGPIGLFDLTLTARGLTAGFLF